MDGWIDEEFFKVLFGKFHLWSAADVFYISHLILLFCCSSFNVCVHHLDGAAAPTNPPPDGSLQLKPCK